MKQRTTDCGLPYGHDPHVYRTTKRGKVKACDGSITKDREPSK